DIGNRMRGIADILVKAAACGSRRYGTTRTQLRRLHPKSAFILQEKLHRFRLYGRPGRILPPLILPRVEDSPLRQRRYSGVLEIMIEKLCLDIVVVVVDIPAKIERPEF